MSQIDVTIGRPLELSPHGEFLLLPFGRVTIQDGPESWEFTIAYAQTLVAAFKRLGHPLVIDYEHQTLSHIFPQFKSPDGTAPAAGWIGDLQVRPDGLWASDVRWTSRATSLLKAGEYRYFSPVIFWADRQWGEPKALGPLALTNDPKLNDTPALAARCDHAAMQVSLSTFNKEFDMYPKNVLDLLGLQAAADDAAVVASITALKNASVLVTAAKAEHETAMTALKSIHAGEITALKSGHETAVTALKSEHETVVTGLKATHGAEVTGLKASHETAVSTLKAAHTAELDGARKKLAAVIADDLELMGKITTASKAGILVSAQRDPELILTTFKNIRVGAVVPVGTLGLSAAKSGAATTGPRSKLDNISTCKAFADSTPETQQLHLMAVAYAEEHGVSYAEAVKEVSPAA